MSRSTFVAFLRAVNVGGRGVIRMEHVRDVFTAAGCESVRTYLQSGNVIFDAPRSEVPALIQNVRTRLGRILQTEPEIVCRSVADMNAIVARAPFKAVEEEPGIKLYVAFLARPPRSVHALPLVSAKEALEAIAIANRDVFVVSRRKPGGFYGFPNNFIEDELETPATTRNWSTVTGILKLLTGGDVRSTADFSETFSALRRILEQHGKGLKVLADKPGEFQVALPDRVDRIGRPLYVAGVQIRKSYVSFHLMPVYADPALLKTISPGLRKRMQGKSCFNFTQIDRAQVKELAALTRSGLARYRKIELPWD